MIVAMAMTLALFSAAQTDTQAAANAGATPRDSAIASAGVAETESEGSWTPTAATRIVCRQMAPHVGSRVGTRRICATAQQWDRWRRENRDVIERVQRTPLSSR